MVPCMLTVQAILLVFCTAVCVRLTRLLLSFLGLTWNGSADELFYAQAFVLNRPLLNCLHYFVQLQCVVLIYIGLMWYIYAVNDL